MLQLSRLGRSRVLAANMRYSAMASKVPSRAPTTDAARALHATATGRFQATASGRFTAASRQRLATADTLSSQYAAVFDPSSTVTYKPLDTFARRHFGPSPENVQHMLEKLGYSDFDQFLEATIPPHVLVKRALNVQPLDGFTELQMLAHLEGLASQNKIVKSFIGKGYYGTHVPPVIQRNLLESPEWYTSYTPYQPEISQGRLESLLNYQTMVTSLTGLPMANASLLDEGTAAAEAMAMSFHHLRGKKPVYVVDSKIHPQTYDVLLSRAGNIGVEIVQLPLTTADGISKFDGIGSKSVWCIGSVSSYRWVFESV